MSHNSAFITSYCGLVLGGDGNSVAPSSWSSVGVVVVVGGSGRSAVEVVVVVVVVVAVVVVASWPGVSSTPVLITRTCSLHLGLVVSGGKTSA